MISHLFPSRDRGQMRRVANRRRPLACESLEPRIALATFAEVEPNTLSEGRKGYYQNLFGSETAEVSARLASESDIDQYQVNVVKGAVVRIHFETEPSLSLSYSLSPQGVNVLPAEPDWGRLPYGATQFAFGPGTQVTAKPLADVSFVAVHTGRVILSVQGGARGTYFGVPYGQIVGNYTVRISGLDPHGDAQVVLVDKSRRRVGAGWSNSTPKKLQIEAFYARGETVDTIIGKSFFAKKLTIPITTKLPAPYEFGGGGIYLPKGRRPPDATHILIVVNRKRAVPEGDFTNNVLAVPLSQLVG